MRKTGILLVLVLATAAAEEPDSAAAWKRLEQEYQKASREFYKPWQDAKAKGEKYQLDYTKHPTRTFLPRYAAFAKQYRGSDEAVRALVRIIRFTTDDEQRSAALETLLKDYLESKAILPAIGTLGARVPDSLDTLIEKTPHRDVKGHAMFARARSLKSTDRDRALRLLQDLKANYFDVAERGTTLSDKADREMFEIVNLAIGQPAPEIEGEDIDGKSFKLSEYLGKVVMLDFWGDW
jgi:hypothetical protein